MMKEEEEEEEDQEEIKPNIINYKLYFKND
jgi:hypothetical protein